jgi:hypothetical protein
MRRHLVVKVDQETGRSEHFLFTLFFLTKVLPFSLCCFVAFLGGFTFFVYDGRMIPEYMKGVSYLTDELGFALVHCDCLT